MSRPRTPLLLLVCFPLLLARAAVAQHAACAGTPHVVTTTADEGAGSLRAAIEAANAAPSDEPQCIVFQIPTADPGFDAATGTWTIQPTSVLPHLSHDDLTLDGSSQTRFAGDTNPDGPEIVLDGSRLAAPGHGLVIAGNRITVRGLVIGRFPFHGVLVVGDNATIVGNYVGVGPDGRTDFGSGLSGVHVELAQLTHIGSGEPGDANVIGGNEEWGIFLRQAPATFIHGNIIGLGADGRTVVGNGLGGIHVDGSSSVAIGSADPAEGNVIAGNGGPGVEIDGTGGQGNVNIAHNRIGTDATGLEARPNQGDGVRLFNGVHLATLSDNVISGNQRDGVHVEGGASIFVGDNRIGAAADGVTALGNGRHGIVLTGGVSASTIGPRNVILGNQFGVQLTDAYGNTLIGNSIGVDVSGQRAPGNVGHGIALEDGAHDNLIGGTSPDARNLIAGNGGHGILLIRAEDNRIVGNFIGTDATGTQALGNGGSGVMIGEAADGTVVGGPRDGEGNLIAANARYGIEVARASAPVIQGNRIGLAAGQAVRLGNALGGISLFLVINAQVGGTTDGAGNVIAGNGGPGVRIAAGGNVRVYRNAIGTDWEGAPDVGNGGDGLVIEVGAQEVTVGRALEDGNVIAGNGGNGVVIRGPGTARHVLAANRIGVVGEGRPLPNGGHGVLITAGAYENRIEAGVIAFNGGDGVRVEGAESVGNRIAPDGITGNGGAGIRLIDGGNRDLAPPRLRRQPVGFLRGTTCPGCVVNVYADPEDEGAQHLAAVTADEAGRFALPLPDVGDRYLTATATDPDTGDTSPFSPPLNPRGWFAFLPLIARTR